VVRVTVEDAKKERFMSSVVLPVDAQGRFSTEGRVLVDPPDVQSLHIVARFTGGKSDPKVTGEALAYTNFTAPFLDREVWWAGAGSSIVIIGLLIFLFTGEMGRAKARLLFATMY